MFNTIDKWILFGSKERAKQFVDQASKVDYPMDLIIGRNVIDAKSLIGVLSFDLSKPVWLKIMADKESDVQEFLDEIKDIVVKDK